MRLTQLVLWIVVLTIQPIILHAQNSNDQSIISLPTGTITKIAFGSCMRQMQDAPLLDTIIATKPDLFLMIGDVIYPDINDEATALLDPWPTKETVDRIHKVYNQVMAKPEWRRLTKAIPMLGIWDDHDYGINDGGVDFIYKTESQKLFLDFFKEPADSVRRTTPGIYDSKIFGPKGKQVQVILLDTRFFRTEPVQDTRTQKEKKELNISGRYAPNRDPEATVLGDAQWKWLEDQLRIPAEVRLLVSSYPVIPNELGRDAWGNMPLERTRLFNLITDTKAKGILILSGDVHFAEISKTNEGPYPLYDFTSSALAAPSVGNEKFKNSFRVSKTYAKDNFGLVEINWNTDPSPTVSLQLIGLSGDVVFEEKIELSDLVVQEKR